MRLSAEEVEKQLDETGYIDAELTGLFYDNNNHLVTMAYRYPERLEKEYKVLFKDCFSFHSFSDLNAMAGDIPQSPNEVSFYFHEIRVKDVEIKGIQLYEISMVIPMMDCKILCKSVEINREA